MKQNSEIYSKLINSAFVIISIQYLFEHLFLIYTVLIYHQKSDSCRATQCYRYHQQLEPRARWLW